MMKRIIGTIGAALATAALVVACASSNTAAKPDNKAGEMGGQKYGGEAPKMEQKKNDNGDPCSGGM
jgi:hypothetical protein